jgi:MFS family permease
MPCSGPGGAKTDDRRGIAPYALALFAPMQATEGAVMSQPATGTVETGYAWLVVAASTLMIATAFGSSYLVVVGLKAITADFGWPRQIPSGAYSLALLGAGIGGIVVGLWADRRGMGLPAIVGGVMIGLGAIIAGYADGALVFLGAHFLLIGFAGNGTMFSPLVTNITRWFDRRRGIAVAIVASGQSLAGAVWPPIFRYTIDEYGWRESMIGYGIVAIAILLPLSLIMRRRAPVRLMAAGEGERGLMDGKGRILGMNANTVMVVVCGAIIGCCVAMSMPMVHIVAHCSDLGFSAARGAEMLSILLAAAFVSRIAYGWLADRLGGLLTLFIGSTLQLCGLALYTVIDSLYGLYAVSIFYGLGYGGIVPMYAIIVRQVFPESGAGWRMGVIFFFGTMGMALGGYVGGVIYDLTATYTLAFLTGIGFNLVNLALVGYLLLRQRGSGSNFALQTA